MNKKLKKMLAMLSMSGAGILASVGAEKGNEYDMSDIFDNAAVTQTIHTDKVFSLPGGIQIKKSELDKIKQDNRELAGVDLLIKEVDGFDGVKLKDGKKTHYLIMNSDQLTKDGLPDVSFLTNGSVDDLTKAHQMSADDFKKVNDSMTKLVIQMGEKGAFDLDTVHKFLKGKAKEAGYSSWKLALAGTSDLLEGTFDTVFEARNQHPDMSLAKKNGLPPDDNKKYYVLANNHLEL